MADDWSVDPFAGEIRDGMLWGRGAVDMKDMDAMILTALGDILGAGERPPRDLIVAFFADEENGGVYGSHWMVDNHPELFAGATEAISEVGGYSIDVGGTPRLPAADRREGPGLDQAHRPRHDRARLTGDPRQRGHQARARRARDRRARMADPPDRAPRARCSRSCARCSAPSSATTRKRSSMRPGTAAGFLRGTLRVTSNPTALDAGYKHNVIPDRAEALIDLRPFAGQEDEVLARIREVIGDEIEVAVLHHDIGLEVPFEGALVDAMVAALGRHDPGAPVLPYLMSGGTDNKALGRLGHHGLRIRAAAADARPRLPGDVPRHRRARAVVGARCSGARCWETCCATADRAVRIRVSDKSPWTFSRRSSSASCRG